MEKTFIGNIEEKFINENEFGGLLIDEREISAVNEVLKSGKIFRYAVNRLTLVDQFENNIKLLFNVKYAQCFNNGTSALRGALFSLGIKENDRVLVSAFTFIASAAAVTSFNAIAVPIEFDINTGMNIQHLKAEIDKGCKAIIIVHLQGRMFDISQIEKLSKENRVYLVEDACQAFGSKRNGKYAGTIGDIGVFSFQQNKIITSGEGGLFVTNNQDFFDRGRSYCDQGAIRDLYPTWDNEKAVIGDNLRMTNIQGALLVEQLKKFNYMTTKLLINRKRVLIEILNDNLTCLVKDNNECEITGMNIFFVAKDKENANIAINIAAKHNVLLKRLWTKPFYKHDVYRRKDKLYSDCKLINSENMADCMLSVPISPTLEDQDVEKLIYLLKKLIAQGLFRGWF